MYVTVVDHAVLTSDGIWEETVSLREEVGTLRAAVDESKDQLLDREDSKLSLICGNDAKLSFTLACLHLQYLWHSVPSSNQRWERLVCGVGILEEILQGENLVREERVSCP